MVHASHPYKAVGNTTVSRTLSFVFLHCPFQIEIIFVNRVVAIASLLLISGVLFPFASILAPRYSKLLTPEIYFIKSCAMVFAASTDVVIFAYIKLNYGIEY